MIRDQLLAALHAALDAAGFPTPPGGVELTTPHDPSHGDFTTNVALQLAGPLGMPPRDVAAKLVVELERARPPHLERVEVAGPGFLNLRLAPTWLHEVLLAVVAAGEGYGHGHALDGLRIDLEFVSANPTGPLHAGGGRWVAVGDALANLLASQGAIVHREYYLNDAGNQLDTFGASLIARYRGEAPPEDGYQGQYVVDMADRMRAELGDAVTEDQAREWGYRDAVQALQDDLGRLGVHFDTWFSERALHDEGDVERVLDDLRARGVVFEHDGATWFRSTEFGDARDRVLVRSDGSATYLLADVARLTFLLQSVDTAQTFDLDVVTAQSMENPVYYVQYAHARIASIGRKAVELGITRRPVLDTSLAPLVHERELDLLRALEAYPGVLAEAATLRAPHRVTTWVRDFAKAFHGFYRDCRVISDDVALTQARLWLAEACRLGLASALAILGVHAPDEMTRLDDESGP